MVGLFFVLVFFVFCCFPGISVVGGLVSSSGANLDAWLDILLGQSQRCAWSRGGEV